VAVSGPALWAAVLVFSGAGALARFLLDATISPRLAGRLPWGTLVVNLTGTFALGVVTGLSLRHDTGLLLGTALLGSYTTFSTWMLESLLLTEDGRNGTAVANVIAQTAAGIALAAAGWGLGAAL